MDGYSSMLMTRNFSVSLVCLFIIGMTHPTMAWDYTTSNPCDTPLAHTPDADVHHTPDNITREAFSATVDLNLPLSSRIDTKNYNADLSASEIDAGTALVTQDGAYVNVLGNEVTPSTQEPAATSAPDAPSPADTKCR